MPSYGLCWFSSQQRNSWPLSFGRETSLHRVGHRIPPGSEHSRQSRASHSCDWPHFLGRDGHLGIAGQVAGKSSDTQCAFRKLWKKYGGVFVKRMCIELAMEAREGPDPEDKAEFHMAATGHLFEDVMATCHPPFNTQRTFPTALEGIRCRPHRRDLTSIFMTFGVADTICPLQLFRIVRSCRKCHPKTAEQLFVYRL